MGGGGGVWNFLFTDQRIVFLSLPLSNSHCFRHPVQSQRGKSAKSGEKHAVKVLSRVVHRRLCPTTYRVYGIVYSETRFCYGDPYSGSMFRSRGGVSDFTTIEGRSQTSVFFRSPLDQKEAIGVVSRSMDPPQAILESRRVRVTLIPGSTLVVL